MKQNKKYNIRKIMTSTAAVIMAASLPLTSLAAAKIDPYFYRTVYKDVNAVYGDNADALQQHYDVFGENEGRSASIQDAITRKDIRSLLIYYLAANAGYYRSEGLNAGFLYFNADAYLKENPDVAAAVRGDHRAALEHYLVRGALEGRGSGTAFDPIIAITARPELSVLTPGELFEAWKKAEGTGTTAAYTLVVRPDAEVPSIYTVKKGASAANTASAENDNSEERKPDPIIDETSTYTLMVYLCGTDLESRQGLREATGSLIKVILGAYDEENVNVVVLAGGTDTWKNTYFNTLLGAGKDGRSEGELNKSAIFVLNKEGIKTVVDELIADLPNVNTVDELYKMAIDPDQWEDMQVLSDYFINEKTLTIYGDVNSSKMGDPSTLVSLLEVAQTEELKADTYGLTLWNHGGGSVEGVCFPEDETGGLTIQGLKEALETAGFGATKSSSAYKLGLLMFDACLMAGAETAAYLSDYYDFMYASEEVTVGDLDYYNIINIANQRAGDKDLSYYLAQAIIEDRAANYKGAETRLSTGALFESGKALDSLNKMNEVAGRLNALVSGDGGKDAQAVYRAFKNARLKCEQIGSAETIDDSKDYVDMKDFLGALKTELEKAGMLDDDLLNCINEAMAAADAATYANSFNYAGQRIYYDFTGSGSIWYNEALWERLKGGELSGANIYIPYYGVEADRVETQLNVFSSVFADTLGLEEYKAFINSFSRDYLMSDQEKERLKNLTDALINGSELDENSETRSISGYADMLEMKLEDTDAGEVLTIKVKDYADGEASRYSSGDSFIDFCETMDTMLVYITRRAEAFYAVNDIVADDSLISISVVVGNQTVSYENLNGLQSSVNFFTDQMNSIDMTIASGAAVGAAATDAVYDFVVPSDLEGYSQKDDIVNLIAGKNKQVENYLTVKGSARVTGTGGTSEVLSSNIYHLFEKNKSGDYVYLGSAQMDASGSVFKVSGVVENVEAITFYHQTIDHTTNKLVYAEEYSYTDAKADGTAEDVVRILGLNGAKEYSAADEIILSGTPISNIGSKDANAYYFAVSRVQVTTDDDIFAKVGAAGSEFNTAPDIFAQLDAVMEAAAEAAVEEAESGAAVAKSITKADDGVAAEEAEPEALEEAEPEESTEVTAENAEPEEVAEVTLEEAEPEEITEVDEENAEPEEITEAAEENAVSEEIAEVPAEDAAPEDNTEEITEDAASEESTEEAAEDTSAQEASEEKEAEPENKEEAA